MTASAYSVATEPGAAGEGAASTERLRYDIQALRALAVASVVLFHLWPGRVPGGYVGVDVFFVISGFLITGHLVREIERTGSIRLAHFWARRAKRLLPAALLVLLATAVATLIVVPVSRWSSFLSEVIASTWYVENWSLANKAVDYLAADASPSPAQQFWSLSVEEQFYIGLPLILVAAASLAAMRGGSRRRMVAITIGVITAGSFAYGVWLTLTSAPTAYFSTFTRAWEFGVGALVALLPSLSAGAPRRLLAWAGIGGILVACLTYDSSVAFPGFAAALPVLATAAVLLACDAEGRGSLGHVGAMAAPSFLGRSSYSIYLWHWPLLILVPFATGVALTLPSKLLVVAATLVLAYLMTRFVEEPVRFNPRLLGGSRPPRVVGAVSLLGMILVTAVAWGGLMVNADREIARAEAATAIVAEDPACFGAAARAPRATGCPNPQLAGLLVPDPSSVVEDDVNRNDCWSAVSESVLRVCALGPASGYSRHLFAVGDSHNNMLLAAYERMAEERNWRIDVAGHNGCYWTTARQIKPTDDLTEACAGWLTNVSAHLAAHPNYDAVITTYGFGRNSVAAVPGKTVAETTVQGIQDAWRPVLEAGTPVLAINDVPELRADIVTCVEQHQSEADTACSSPRARALAPFNGLEPAVAASPGSALIDLTDFYCDTTRCLPLVGNVVIYRDRDHISATFARTLAPYLGSAIDAELTALRQR